MFTPRLLFKFVQALNAGATPNQLAAGFTLGFMLGLVPGWPWPVLLILLLIGLFNVNIAMSVLGAAVAVVLAWIFDPLLDAFGYWLLTGIPALKPLWTGLYNHPIGLLSRFNNTVVMGAFAGGLLAAVPLFFLMRVVVNQYRQRVLERVRRLRIVQLIKANGVYRMYERYKGMELGQ